MDQWGQFQNMPHENVNWAELAQQWMQMKSSQDDDGSNFTDQTDAGYQASFDNGNSGPSRSLFPSVSGESWRPVTSTNQSNNGYKGSWDYDNQHNHGEFKGFNGSNNFEYRTGGFSDDWHGGQRQGAYEERSQSPGGPMGALPMWPPAQDWTPPTYPEDQKIYKEPSSTTFRNVPHSGPPPPSFFPPPEKSGSSHPVGFHPPFPPPFGFGVPPNMAGSQVPHKPSPEVPMFNMPADQRKKLPAWIREGLEKAEKEKQKQFEKEERIKRAEEEKAKKKAVTGRGKFDSSSDEEDNEADDERSNETGSTEPILDVDPVFHSSKRKEIDSITEEYCEDDRTEDEKRSDAIAIIRTIMMDLLLETTDSELNRYILNAMSDAKRKAEPKLLAKSTALAALSSFGDDDDSDAESDSDQMNSVSAGICTSEETFKAPIGLPMKKSKQDSPKPCNSDVLARADVDSETDGKLATDKNKPENCDTQYRSERKRESDVERDHGKNKKRRKSRSRDKSRDRKRSRSRERKRSRSRSRDRERVRRSKSRERRRSRSRDRKRSRSRDRRRDSSRDRDSKKERRSRSRERKRARSKGRR